MTQHKPSTCWHCGEPIPSGVELVAHVQGHDRPMCCHGCQMVAHLIHGAGLDRYYDFRDALPNKPSDELKSQEAFVAWDRDAVLAHHAKIDCDGIHTLYLVLENVHCSACAWLIHKFLKAMPGVVDVAVDTSDGRMMLRFNPKLTPLSQIATQLNSLGYPPHLDSHEVTISRNQSERRLMLKYLVVSGLGMMQVMSYALAGYIGAFQDIDDQTARFFQLVSMLVAVPVALYAGQSFYKSAWNTLKHGRLGMDVPVTVAILIALGSSIGITFFGSGETYFDSVVMFIFFLLLGRYAVMVTRQNAGQLHSALARSLPSQVSRLTNQGTEQVGLVELMAGDRVQLGLAETLPCDGVIMEGEAAIDESLLSGESKPYHRRVGDRVLAGTQIQEGQVVVKIEKTGQETALSGVIRLLDQARHFRPKSAQMADQVAGWFIGFVLIGAVIAGIVWWFIEPMHALPIMLSILVVSCPCALALGTPVSLAAAARGFAKLGLLINEPNALESLSKATHVIFDKTGTLTQSAMGIVRQLDDQGRPCHAESVKTLIGRLERISRHPIASAFSAFDDGASVSNPKESMHLGVQGQIDGVEYCFGKPKFVGEFLNQTLTLPDDGSWLVLANKDGVIAWFELDSPLRRGAHSLIHELQSKGLEVWLASGDQNATVHKVAKELGIQHVVGECSPEDKLRLMRQLQAQGARVIMIGDGINDAPVLAGADVSISLAEGADIARTQADMVMTGQSLVRVHHAFDLAPRVKRVIRQNLTWAISYNLLAFPLAAMGWIPPWAAAIGMSASSLLVVLNGRRAGRIASTEPATHKNTDTHEPPLISVQAAETS